MSVEPIPVMYPETNNFGVKRHRCLVKLTTEDGVVGWGESIAQRPRRMRLIGNKLVGKFVSMRCP